MTSETPHLHVSKNLNISKTKQDIEKLKTLLRLYGNVVLVCLKLGQRFFRCSGTLTFLVKRNRKKIQDLVCHYFVSRRKSRGALF